MTVCPLDDFIAFSDYAIIGRWLLSSVTNQITAGR